MALVPPGEHIKDELDARSITQAVFARHIAVSPAYLSDIVRGRRGISAEMAIKLGKALGTGPELWLNLQTQYELDSLNPDDYEISEIAA